MLPARRLLQLLPKRPGTGVLILGASSAGLGVWGSGSIRCDASSAHAPSPAACQILSRLREKFSICHKTKADKRLASIHEAEERLLQKMLPGTPYEVLDVPVEVDGFGKRCKLLLPEREFRIHTVVVGMEHRDKPPIVLVHGFMMGAASFWKLLPLLATQRTVYAIDIIGMGGSSRPPFNPQELTAEDVEELLAEPFEQWARQLGLDRFLLLGHSFGGLVCAYWATRHPERVSGLGLLSPCLGFSDERIDSFTAGMKNGDATWQRRAFFTAIESIWVNHITPQSLVRWVPGFKSFMSSSTERRYRNMASGITDEESKLLSQYVVATMDQPASTEQAGPVLFEPFLRPVEVAEGSIKERLCKFGHAPIFAVYGDHDWMEKPPDSDIPNCDFITLGNSGHHLALDNPQGLAQLVLNRANRMS